MYEIHFYQTDRPYGCFSNFAVYPIQLDGKDWPTTEHYFQAQKFKGTRFEEAVRTASTPMQAARLGRQPDLPLRSDWEVVKDDIMRAAVRAKTYISTR
ncbi:MAG TPA: NADAR family protein [Symbiobacteriaceae bacterium]|nr:NADAR family protein [Symbiobacteriaceae bacterium]